MNINLQEKPFINDDYEQEGALDFGRLFRSLLMQSKLIIIISFIGSLVGLLLYLNAERIYKINSLLQVYSPNNVNSGQEIALDLYLGSSATSNLNSTIELYKSRSNLIEVIKAKKINIEVDDALKKSIIFFEVRELADRKKANLKISVSDNTFDILDENSAIGTFNYGKTYDLGKYYFQIQNPNLSEKSLFELSYSNPEDNYKSFKEKISIKNVDVSRRSNYIQQDNGLLEISLLTNDIEEGKEILDFTSNLFIKKNIEFDSEQARQTINFLDLRISSIEEQLISRKSNLKDFRESNKTLNVDLEIESIIKSLNNISVEINALDIQISQASKEFTSTNPIYQALLDQKNILLKQKGDIENQIQKLPIAQQEYIDLFRELETSQQIYSELLNKRLEFSIKEASTLGNTRIVDKAYYDTRVSPTLSNVILISIISFILSAIVAIFRSLYFTPITNPAELADSNIRNSIVGVFPVVSAEITTDDQKFQNAMESLIINIDAQYQEKSLPNDKAKKVLISGATPSIGKSFVSTNLAKALAAIGKKTLLIDGDFKKGTHHTSFGVNKISVNDFRSISNANIDKYKVSDNLYLLPKISKLSSSFQFFYSKDFENKLNELQELFDYIIIDTAPILAVSDTSILLSHSDLNFSVVRHGETKLNEVKQLLSISNQIGTNFDGIIYNAYEKPSSYYGYYGLYGNYAYQYYAKRYLYEEYDYKNED
tara:strand:+ start:494 stop:2635 length:2142 start_codon:yes stop_codon:yes gene_type:complete